jgi:hypothetical protein
LLGKYCTRQDFTCPARVTVGDQGWARKKLKDDALRDPVCRTSTYSYEFIDKPWQNTYISFYDYKNAQREYLRVHFGRGDDVPILRCFMHSREKVINLSFAGKFTESRTEWEDEFGKPHDQLEIQALFPELRVSLDSEIPPRPERLEPELLDLTTNYNAVIDRSWYRSPTQTNIPFGKLLANPKFSGAVNFDVRGVIQLKAPALRRTFPLRIKGIKVGQCARRLHFLLGACGEAGAGQKIAAIRLHFTDQPPAHFDVAYGDDLLDWCVDPAETPFSQIHKNVAWVGECVAENGKAEPIRLYDFQVINPNPNEEILSIDFEVAVADSIVSESAPALFAITLEPDASGP